VPDLEASYTAAIGKGGTAPSGRTAEALYAWCTARGGTPARTAQAVADFIAAYSTGYQQWTSPGTYSFTVPTYSSLTVTVFGAGGGGGGIVNNGSTGGDTSFGGLVICTAGRRGFSAANGGGNGALGTASGGDTNTSGGGSPGGVGAWDRTSDKSGTYDSYGGNGSAGGYAIKTFSAGALTVGSTVTITVGAGGTGGDAGNQRAAAAGENGLVTLGWS